VAHPDLIDQVLDQRYRVIERVGEGAMGSVFRAERVKLGRIVAVKVMNEALLDPAARARFEREAMAMAKLEHPNCASVVDVGVHGDQPYVVMEFVTGKTLKQILEASAVPVPRAVDIVRQILSGLSHAHEHGVIHRDIKPANIVLSQKAGLGDHVKILDFGLARFNKEASNLTKGFVLGTPNYMAPEQIKGGDFDHRIDLYACGVVLFELLTGKKPFTSDSNDPVQICMQHLNAKPPRLAEALPGKDFGALEGVVARALAKDRDQRYQTAEELSAAITEAAGKTAPTAPAVNATVQLDPDLALEPSASVTNVATLASTPARPGRGKRTVALVGAAAAAAALVVVFIATRGDAEPPKPTAAPVVEKPAPAPAEPPPPPPSDGADAVLAKASDMVAAGRREAALDVLLAARKTFPKDGRVTYEAAKLYLEKMWWADGLKLARAAIDLDPAYKSDADLIKLVVRGFNTTKSVDWTLASFLRKDIGAPAKPFLEDAATKHPNPIVRARAKAELRNY
jgi:serine/threonine-protein kinase